MTTQIASEPLAAVGQLAEPALSFSLYPAPGTSLDKVISNSLAPCWRRVSADLAGTGHLWFIRHNARGPHLKLRIHCPASSAPQVRDAFVQAVTGDPLFDRSQVEDSPQAQGAMLGPEDREAGSPGRPLVATTFERHAAIFDPGVLASDDEATSLFLHCLAAGSELVLRFFDAGHPNLHSHRQNVLIQIISLGMAELFDNDEDRAAYLAFHRDWMIRFPVLWSGYGKKKAHQVLSIYRAQVQNIPRPAFGNLHELLGDRSAPRGSPDEAIAKRRFQEPLSRYIDFLEAPTHARKVGNPDPFAEGVRHPALLKILHTLANQLGITKVDEGFVHHLLLTASGGAPETDSVFLAPAIDAEGDDEIGKAFTPKVAAFEEDYSWMTYVLEGCTDPKWKNAFFDEGQDIFQDCGRALTMLRTGEAEAAKILLDRVEARQQALRSRCASLSKALGRFYYGTLAYYYYVVADPVQAVALLREAEQSVADAISLETFLTPMAPLVTDIPLQKARVARRLKEWDQMESHLQELRDYLEDRKPLCILADGRGVTHETLRRHFATLDLSSTDGKYRAAVEALVDPAQRYSEFRRRYAELYAPRFRLMPFP